MEGIWTIIITAVVLIISALVSSRKKKSESGAEEGNASPFSFFEEEDLEDPFERKEERPVLNKKTYFTYDNNPMVNTKIDIEESVDNLSINTKELASEEEKKDFNIKEAIIYSEILNRPYN